MHSWAGGPVPRHAHSPRPFATPPQSSLLDDLEQGVDTTHASMKANNSKLNKLRKATKDNWLYCTILLLIVALIVVLYFVMTD